MHKRHYNIKQAYTLSYNIQYHTYRNSVSQRAKYQES